MKPTIGRIVHVNFKNARERRVTRPAIIVEDWGASRGADPDAEQRVNLQTFLDGENDGSPQDSWMTSVAYGEPKEDSLLDAPPSWFWPLRA